MTVDPSSVRGRIVYASPANSRALLVFRLLFWGTGSALAALTPANNGGAPVWIWPPALVACLLMAGQTLGAMRRRASGAP
ncbi:hypothetical protein [Streptomyces sp. B21-083]|uniref:hypothetical protein n=1 Tax=Streptomyces sp. B21-083 TaxID=3039410 RepID=UPI002FF195D2